MKLDVDALNDSEKFELLLNEADRVGRTRNTLPNDDNDDSNKCPVCFENLTVVQRVFDWYTIVEYAWMRPR